MDINVNDDHSVGCAIARAADAHLSNSDDSSHTFLVKGSAHI